MRPTAVEQAVAALQVAPVETIVATIAFLVALVAQIMSQFTFNAVASTAGLIAITGSGLLLQNLESIRARAQQIAKKCIRNEYPH